MAGATLTVDIEDRAVSRAFDQLSRIMRNTTPVMSAIGTGLVASTHRRFVSQTDPDGNPWAALNPEYAEGKRNSRILTESGGLRDSITAAPSRTSVQVGTNKIYAAIHQMGGVIKPKGDGRLAFRIGDRLVRPTSVTIPARPYLGISTEDETMIGDTIFGFLNRRLHR